MTEPTPPAPTLAQWLRRGRENRGVSQADLARQVELPPSILSNYEQGKRRPTLQHLSALASALRLDLTTGLLQQLRDEVVDARSATIGVVRESAQAEGDADPLRAAVVELDKYLNDRADGQGGTAGAPRTLQNLRSWFHDVWIVTGDRRESPPKRAGDLGAHSASPIDDRWLLSLGLPRSSIKISDKELISQDSSHVSEFGRRHLLVLGSPASNHVARHVNHTSLFHFNLHGPSVALIDELLAKAVVQEQVEHMEPPDKKTADDVKRALGWFKTHGIVDPIRRDVTGHFLPGDKDFAVVSLAANPFSPPEVRGRFWCVFVAGFHHPGTAKALHWLSEPANFAQHPYGGVIEVAINSNLPWGRRSRQAKASWDTRPYTPNELRDGLVALRSKPSAGITTSMQQFDTCLQLLDYLDSEPGAAKPT